VSTDGHRSFKSLLVDAIVIVAAAGFFAYGLQREPEFVDEAADIAHTYFYRLAVRGEIHHVDWLHPAAYDHLPVFKYILGAAVRLAGEQPIDSLRPWELWMQSTYNPSAMPAIRACLPAARIAMLVGAVFGCWMAYRLGRALVGPRTGILAAILLAASPVYYVHARRAMADDLTQGLVIAGLIALARLLAAAIAHKWRALGWSILCGLAAGLAAGTKLNGATAALSVVLVGFLIGLAAVWSFGKHIGAGFGLTTVAACVIAVLVSIAVFVGINPYLYAQPDLEAAIEPGPRNTVIVAGQIRSLEYVAELRQLADMGIVERTQVMLDHRAAALNNAKRLFPEDALPTVWQRAARIATEGIGRWFCGGVGVRERAAGLQLPVPPTVWFIVPGLLTVIGLAFAWQDGCRQLAVGQAPIAWVLVVWPVVEVSMLLQSLTLNWDRYYLGVVAWTSMLVAYALSGVTRRLRDRLVLFPPNEETGP
jgi:hypothetical protein